MPGQAIYELKHPFRDGTTHILFTPRDFPARLAAGRSRANALADGEQGAHILLAPPFIFGIAHVDELVTELASVLKQVGLE